mgnify:FL=1
MGFLSGLLDSAGSIYAFDDSINQVEAIGEDQLSDARSYGAEYQQDTAFKPFTVTSGLGSSAVNAQGGVTQTLGEEQTNIQNLLQSQGQQFLGAGNLQDYYNTGVDQYGLGSTADRSGSLLGGLDQTLSGLGLGRSKQRENDLIGILQGGGGAGREQEIFNQLQAVQQPGQERDRLALEQRLFSQGRGGVQTSQYGGTPEQFAMSKAQEEARLGASVQARQLANQEQQVASQQALQGIQQGQAETSMFGALGLQGNEQALQQLQAESQARQAAGQQALQTQGQQYQIGQSLLDQSYRPNQELINQLEPGVNLANIAGLGQRQGAELSAALSEAGLQQRGVAQGVAANLRSDQIEAIQNIISAGTTAAGNYGSNQLAQGNTAGAGGFLNQVLSGLFG